MWLINRYQRWVETVKETSGTTDIIYYLSTEASSTNPHWTWQLEDRK